MNHEENHQSRETDQNRQTCEFAKDIKTVTKATVHMFENDQVLSNFQREKPVPEIKLHWWGGRPDMQNYR